MSEITDIPLASDRAVLRCPVCDLTLTPRDIAASTGITRFAITEGRCPLCVLNAIVQGHPELLNLTANTED